MRDVESIGAGCQEYRKTRRLLAVEIEYLSICLSTELDATDIAQPRQVARGAGFDDDVGELFGIVETARNVDRVLERLVALRRRHSHLSGGHLLALRLLKKPGSHHEASRPRACILSGSSRCASKYRPAPNR